MAVNIPESSENYNSETEIYVIPDSPVNDFEDLIDKDLEEEEKMYQSMNEELDKQIAKDNEAIQDYISRNTEDTPMKRIRYFNNLDNSHINNCKNKPLTNLIVKQHTANGTLNWHLCSICCYKTQEKEKLTQHVTRCHSNFKPDEFNCDNCTDKFEEYYGLLRHKKQKHKTITFSCNKCDFISIEESDLIEHRISQHNSLNFCWFKCGQCTYRTAKKHNLDKHIKQKHTFF